MCEVSQTSAPSTRNIGILLYLTRETSTARHQAAQDTSSTTQSRATHIHCTNYTELSVYTNYRVGNNDEQNKI